MGCGASKAALNPTATQKPPARGAPLSEWTEQDVSTWLDAGDADLQKYRSALRPTTGRAVAHWTHAELVGKGLNPADAARLLAYRNTVVTVPPAGPAPAGPAPAGSVGGAQQGDPSAARSSNNEDAAVTGAITTASSEQDAVPDASGATAGAEQPQIAKSRKEELAALLTKGLQLTRATIAKIGPMLPFPGAEAAALVVTLMDVVATAITNHSNLRELQQRAVALLDILLAYHTDLMALKKYKGVVDEFQDVLQGVITYARGYGERNCLMRLLTGGSDKEHYGEVVARMAVLCERMMLAVAVDSNARVQQLERMAQQSLELLQQAAEYKDPSLDARVLVSELGGLEAVLADGDKLGRVMQRLDVSARVTIQAISSLLASHLDSRSPQRHIRQPDLRLFWKHQYAGVSEVPWFVFWEHFPLLLKHTPADAVMVSELGRLLADAAARRAFQQAVSNIRQQQQQQSASSSVSVWELRAAFRGDDSLLSQVAQLLPGGPQAAPAAGSGDAAAAGGGHRPVIDNAGGAPPLLPPTAVAGAIPLQPVLPVAGPAAAGGVTCQLPPLVSNYVGRAGDASGIVVALQTRGSVVLVAPGGMGKSCLAADVGWRLMNGGAAGGALQAALWVDLREANSSADVEARFCATLGLQPGKSDNTHRIVAALKVLGGSAAAAAGSARQQPPPADNPTDRLCSMPMVALVVVDNAEDALLQTETAEVMRNLLSRVVNEAIGVRLLVTSRVSITKSDCSHVDRPGPVDPASTRGGGCPVQQVPLLLEQDVGVISRDAAVHLVLAIAADLAEPEAAAVSASCSYVPLLLCLVAEAMLAGRLTLEDLPNPESRRQEQLHDGSRSRHQQQAVAPTDTTGGTVRLVLSGLRKQHQQAASQLTLFPSSFNSEGAAAILGKSEPQARDLLAVLYRYSVLQRAGPQTYIMHMVVRQQAAQLGAQLNADLVARAEGRYVGYFLRLLGEWAAMYFTAKEWRLSLAMARHHQQDICKLADVLAGASPAADPGLPVITLSDRGPAGCYWDPLTVAEALDFYVRTFMSVLALESRWEKAFLALRDRLLRDGTPAAPSTLCGQPAACPTGMERALAMIQLCLAAVASHIGRDKEAEEAAREGWRLLSGLLGPDDIANAGPLTTLGAVLYNATRYADAESFNRQALVLRQVHQGDEHIETLNTLSNLCGCVIALERHDEAETLCDKVAQLRLKLLGEEHPDTAKSYNNLANYKRSRGGYREAEALYRRAVELQRRILGNEHIDTTHYLYNLADCIDDDGRSVEAEPLYREAFELYSRVLGERHMRTILALHVLAVCVRNQDRWSEAEVLCREAVERRNCPPGEEDDNYLVQLWTLAKWVGKGGRHSEAEPLLRRILEAQRRLLGDGHDGTAEAVKDLADCLRAQGRSSEAAALLKEAADWKAKA